jgi:lipopolysaccharide transport system ATP-binding protein
LPLDAFWALRDVSFDVGEGKTIGVIGPNGSGKSTLLRLIGGVGRPSEGSVRTRGRIGALLELGAGFHPDLTGRENVFINGVISGLTRREVERRLDSIVDFAELADYIDSPLRTYSTGMQMRLAFTIASHVEPDILLIDEVLAVGDVAFQEKCFERIEQFKARGCTVLMVSHDPQVITQFCDEAIWLRAGRMVMRGPADVVTGQYLGVTKSETERRTPREWPVRVLPSGVELRVNQNRIGSLEMEITGVSFAGADGRPVTQINKGEALRIDIDYDAPQPIDSPIFAVTVTREDWFVCYDTSTASFGRRLPAIRGKGRVSLDIERLDLAGDRYYVDVGVYTGDWAYAYDYHWHVYPFEVRPTEGENGLIRPPHRWHF